MLRSTLLVVVIVALVLALATGCWKKAAPPEAALAPPAGVATAPAPGSEAPAIAPEGTPPAAPEAKTPAAPAGPGKAPGSKPAAPTAPNRPTSRPRGTPPAVAPLTGELAQIEAARKKLTSYESKLPAGPGGERTTAFKLADGKPVRTKMSTPNGYVLTMTDKHVTYMVDTQAKTATKLALPTWGARAPGGGPGGGEQGRPNAQPRSGEGDRPSGARGGGGRPGGLGGPGGRSFELAWLAMLKPKISSTKLEGRDCWLLEWKDPQGNTGKMWMDKQYGLARQSEGPQGTIKFTYSRVNAIPAQEFELPSGLTVKEAQPGQGGWGGRGAGGPGGRGAPSGENRGEGGPPRRSPSSDSSF